jgi:hypothetical protein
LPTSAILIFFKIVKGFSRFSSTISCLSLMNWKKYPNKSLFISNSWAGLSVQKHGTGCPDIKELQPYLEDLNGRL